VARDADTVVVEVVTAVTGAVGVPDPMTLTAVIRKS